jgi:hypothetical protein
MRRSMAELAASLQSAVFERPLPTQQCLSEASLEENAGENINTSLDYAAVLLRTSLPSGFSSKTADQTREPEIESGKLQQDQQLLATVTQNYRVKALELMTANVKANLEYATKLKKLRTPFEFFELSTGHAQKQFELIMSHTTALRALSQSLTSIWPTEAKKTSVCIEDGTNGHVK